MLKKLNNILSNTISNRARLFILIASFGIIVSYFMPVWHFKLLAPQYPEGLDLSIYFHKLEGGDNGSHVEEINILNHYIGMKSLDREQLKDLDWIPFAMGLLIIFGIRMAFIGNLRHLLDLVMFSLYLTGFIAARFVYTLYSLGHNLNPEAPVNVEPFMPVIVGSKQIANFTTYSYPDLGSAFLAFFAITITCILIKNIRDGFKNYNS